MKSNSNLTCAEFQNRLPELIGASQHIATHPHLEDCPNCRALLGDLEAIAAAARQLFPVAEPPDHLWDHIQSAMNNENGRMNHFHRNG